MIEVLYARTDHGRSVHVTICNSGTGTRDDLTRFIVPPDVWTDLREALAFSRAHIRQDDHYERLDRGLHV